jgi:hypothetical protein
MLASALAIELLVAMLHSPLLDSAPADTPSNGHLPNESNPVGLIPHQIRGFVANYSNMLIVGHAYDRCTACSAHVLHGYKVLSRKRKKNFCSFFSQIGKRIRLCAGCLWKRDVLGGPDGTDSDEE